MGADIHVVMQKREDGKWKTINKNLYDGRNYRLFGALAGVRGDGPYVSAPSHLPSDFEHHKTEDGAVYHEDVYMGYHNFGYLHLDSYLSQKLTVLHAHALEPLTEAIFDRGMLEACEFDDDFDYGNFRMVWGFDS